MNSKWLYRINLSIASNVIALFIALNPTMAQAAKFYPITDFPEEFRTNGLKLSGDGRTVAFEIFFRHLGPLGSLGYIWREGEITPLKRSPIPADQAHQQIGGISYDGSRIVGRTSGLGTVIWDGEGNILRSLQAEPNFPPFFRAMDMSDDGRIVIGLGVSRHYEHTYYWSEEEGVVEIDTGLYETLPIAVSGDGKTITGEIDWITSDEEPFVWTSALGLEGLGRLRYTPYRQNEGSPTDISADGKVIVGNAYGDNGIEGFRWTRETGMVGLGLIEFYPGFIRGLGASATNRNGSVIAGGPFVWVKGKETRRFTDLLESQNADLMDWTIHSVWQMSHDGLWMAGYGKDKQGIEGYWLANLLFDEDLSILIESLDLPASEKIGLKRRWKEVARQLNSENDRKMTSAVEKQLEAFKKYINARIGKTISEKNAKSLLNGLQLVQESF